MTILDLIRTPASRLAAPAIPAIPAIRHDHATRTVAKIANVAVADPAKPAPRAASSPYPLGKESPLSAQGLGPVPVCPADVAERSAIIAEGDRCDRSEADERALGAHRFPSWSALADALRAEILAQLDRLPPSCGRDGERLLEMTRAFVESSWFRQAVEKGWSIIELFGISPHQPVVRVGDWGLVITLALLTSPGTKIDSIAEDGATFSTRSVARNKWPRFRPALRDCVLWWECRQIIAMEGRY